MSVGNLQAIGPVPARPPRYSLLVATDTVEADTVPASGIEQSVPREWGQGIEWSPEQFAGGKAIAVDCLGRTPDGLDPSDNPMINTAEPFVVYAADSCSTFGFAARDAWGRVRRQLLATQSFQIAREFQLGTLRTAANPDLENVALVDAIELTGASLTPLEALAILESAIGERFQGAAAMIHVTPQVLTLLHGAQGIYLSGQKWVTALGSVVVADAGYTTVDGDEWMYATAIVKVRLGGIIMLPDETNRAQAVDRATNDQQVVAERLALVQVDASEVSDADAMFKIEVDVDAVVSAS